MKAFHIENLPGTSLLETSNKQENVIPVDLPVLAGNLLYSFGKAHGGLNTIPHQKDIGRERLVPYVQRLLPAVAGGNVHLPLLRGPLDMGLLLDDQLLGHERLQVSGDMLPCHSRCL